MKCISAAYVNEALNSKNVVITGNFTKEEAQYLADLINSGALPTKLVEEATPKSVSPSFGSETISKTGLAGLITFVLISLILILKYRVSGLVGSICLFVYALLVFAIFNAVDGVLTLTGIAALVLGIGMAVDSIIISNERIKDELYKNSKLIQSYKEGIKSSLVAIVDANITTLIAGIVLYIFGESSVKGFATMLIITIFVTIISTVVLYRFLLSLAIKTKFFNEKQSALFGKIRDHRKFDYVQKSRIPMIISVCIIALGIAFAIVRGFNFGVDFTGGTNIVLSSEKDIDFKKVNEIVKDYDVRDYDYYMGTNKEGFVVLNDILEEENEIKVKNELLELGIESSSSEISTLVTKSLTKNAIKALLYSLVAIIIYITIRFNFNYAITGILMLLHDVLIILSIFAVLHIRVDFIIVASLLTIIGYSINDTIVVFDRIRENRSRLYRTKKVLTDEELKSLVNTSSVQTVNRNIWTSITTIVSVLTLIFIGLSDIFTFNIAVLIGLIAGTISSLLIGPRIWMAFERRSMLKPEDDDDDEVHELKIKGIND
jgi:SecD/SecF fusion protein